MSKKLKPTAIDGIEFDALIDEQKDLTATIPNYPVEKGFPVSDTIILDPISLQMTLYVTNTPVTWVLRHGTASDRVNKICDKIEKKWLEKKLVKVVTTDAIYKNMGIVSLSIKKSQEIGYAREISAQFRKVEITEITIVKIPAKILKSGKTKANAGKASTSKSSKKSSTGNATTSKSSSSKNSKTGKSKASSSGGKKSSILYKAAKKMGVV